MRDLRRKDWPAGGVTVYLRGGMYPLRESFVLTTEDSGEPSAPVRYAAFNGEPVRIHGGVVIPPAAFLPVRDSGTRTRLSPDAADRILVADLRALGVGSLGPWPDFSLGAGGAMELFFDGKPARVARWPKDGWSVIAGVVNPDRDDRLPGRPAAAGAFHYSGDRPARWNVEEGVWASGYWSYDWGFDTVRIASIDSATRTIAMAAPTTYGFTQDGDRRYFVENLLEELDSPGEYYLDWRRGRLYFYPPAAPGADSCILSTLCGPLITMDNASHVSLEGLTIECGRSHGVEISNGRGNRVQACVLRNTGGAGVRIAGGFDHGVSRCEIAFAGTLGIEMEGGDRQTLTPSGHFATGNDIHHFSRLQRTYAAGIQLRGVGHHVAHCELHDAPHTVIQVAGNDHVVEYNEIHDVSKETGDVGVIGMGRDWASHGNIIRYNFIHHFSGRGSVGAVAVYVDDMGSGFTIYGNVVYKGQRAFLIGGGRHNIVTNNLVYESERFVQLDSRGLNWTKHYMEEDGFLKKGLAGLPYKMPPWSTRFPELARIMEDQPDWPKGNVFRNNVLCFNIPMWIAKEFPEVSDVGGNLELQEDPGFVDISRMDLTLKDDSIVYRKLPDFKPIPFKEIGLKRK